MAVEGVGIIIPILQMRNQRLRKMKQLPLRSHRLQLGIPAQTVSPAHALKDHRRTALRAAHTAHDLVSHLHRLQSIWSVLYTLHILYNEFGPSLHEILRE